MSSRTIAIGDIHGCLTALNALLEEISPTPDDRVVVVGDYVDRGPDSCGVVDRLLALQGECQLIPLMGNHELMMLRGLDDPLQRPVWLYYGGQETLASYGGDLSKIPTSHLDFLNRGFRLFETDTHFFVHANYVPDLPLSEQPEETALWAHQGPFPPPPHLSGKTAVVGHTPQVHGEVLDWGHLKCIDTYCYGGRRLTALDTGSGQVWQSTQGGRVHQEWLTASP